MPQVHLIDLLPKEWMHSDGCYHLMQSTYQCLFFSPNQHGRPYVTGQIDEVFYLIIDLQEELTVPIPFFEWSSGGNEVFATIKTQNRVAPKGVHLMLFTPFNEAKSELEPVAIAQIESALGLINALEGKNASLVHRFNQSVVVPNGPRGGVSSSELSPATFPHPFKNLGRVPEVAKRIAFIEVPLRSRISLALRWFDKSQRESDPLDAFLKAWFALEILAMPNDTNVKPILEALAAIYGLTPEESRDYYQIGRIQGLRSSIIHKGAIVSIHYQLQKFVQAVFVDILMHVIGHPSEKRTNAVLNDTSAPHSAWRP